MSLSSCVLCLSRYFTSSTFQYPSAGYSQNLPLPAASCRQRVADHESHLSYTALGPTNLNGSTTQELWAFVSYYQTRQSLTTSIVTWPNSQDRLLYRLLPRLSRPQVLDLCQLRTWAAFQNTINIIRTVSPSELPLDVHLTREFRCEKVSNASDIAVNTLSMLLDLPTSRSAPLKLTSSLELSSCPPAPIRPTTL